MSTAAPSPDILPAALNTCDTVDHFVQSTNECLSSDSCFFSSLSSWDPKQETHVPTRTYSEFCESEPFE
eukprot:1483712-Heterocapsa_arctica.AAC.1